jgi:uroporphyrinogen decarboxylase
MLQIADDYGTQRGLMMSPQMWRVFFAPHLETLADMAHNEGIKVFLHCCGSSREIIPDLIALGIDILNPIQPQAKGMDPRDLKAHFGNRLCFHGGIDTQKTLPFGSVNDVKEEVIDRLTIFGKEGGYILAPVHTIEPDVPLENILALYEAAKKFN